MKWLLLLLGLTVLAAVSPEELGSDGVEYDFGNHPLLKRSLDNEALPGHDRKYRSKRNAQYPFYPGQGNNMYGSPSTQNANQYYEIPHYNPFGNAASVDYLESLASVNEKERAQYIENNSKTERKDFFRSSPSAVDIPSTIMSCKGEPCRTTAYNNCTDVIDFDHMSRVSLFNQLLQKKSIVKGTVDNNATIRDVLTKEKETSRDNEIYKTSKKSQSSEFQTHQRQHVITAEKNECNWQDSCDNGLACQEKSSKEFITNELLKQIANNVSLLKDLIKLVYVNDTTAISPRSSYHCKDAKKESHKQLSKETILKAGSSSQSHQKVNTAQTYPSGDDVTTEYATGKEFSTTTQKQKVYFSQNNPKEDLKNSSNKFVPKTSVLSIKESPRKEHVPSKQYPPKQSFGKELLCNDIAVTKDYSPKEISNKSHDLISVDSNKAPPANDYALKNDSDKVHGSTESLSNDSVVNILSPREHTVLLNTKTSPAKTVIIEPSPLSFKYYSNDSPSEKFSGFKQITNMSLNENLTNPLHKDTSSFALSDSIEKDFSNDSSNLLNESSPESLDNDLNDSPNESLFKESIGDYPADTYSQNKDTCFTGCRPADINSNPQYYKTLITTTSKIDYPSKHLRINSKMVPNIRLEAPLHTSIDPRAREMFLHLEQSIKGSNRNDKDNKHGLLKTEWGKFTSWIDKACAKFSRKKHQKPTISENSLFLTTQKNTAGRMYTHTERGGDRGSDRRKKSRLLKNVETIFRYSLASDI